MNSFQSIISEISLAIVAPGIASLICCIRFTCSDTSCVAITNLIVTQRYISKIDNFSKDFYL